MKRLSYFSAILVLLLTAAAFALRLAYLLHSHPFIDEFTTVLAARAILQRGLPILPSGLFYEHGLLFTYLDAPFAGLAGERGWFAVARLPSLIIGTVTVPLLYWVGRRWLSPQAGLVAAALLAFSPEGMVWGGRARMYTLVQLLVLLLAFLVYEGSRGDGRLRRSCTRSRIRWLALLTLLAALLAQLGALILAPPLVVGGLIVGWLTRPPGDRPWFLRHAALAEGAVLAVVVGLGVLVKRSGQPLGAAPLGGDSADNLLAELAGTVTYQTNMALDGENALRFLAREFGVPHHLWLTFIAVVGGFLGLAVWIVTRRKSASKCPYSHTPYSLLLTSYSSSYLWLVFGLTVVEMVTLLEPWRRNPRYLVMVLPLFYLIVAASLKQISNIKYQMANPALQRILDTCHLIFVISFIVVQAILLVPDLRIAYRTPEPAYEEAFQYVVDQWQPGDVLLTMNTSAAGLYLNQTDYSPQEICRFAIQDDAEQFLLNADTQPVDRWLGAPWVGAAADFNRILNEHPRVWFVVDTIRLPRYYRGDWLALVHTQMSRVWAADEALVYLTRPDRSPLPSTPQVTLDAQLGDVVRLDGYAVVPSSDRSTLQLTLFWTGLAPADTDYTIFAHLRDTNGSTVAQWDGPPLAGAYPTSQWRAGESIVTPVQITLPASLPSGQYRLYVGLYRLDTLERLPVTEDTSGENAVVLSEVTLP